ncbi:transcriptional regulator GcvA [Pelagibius litoralis]|uniref:Transcriptional regulator GcvA n=1 Tax=Pelagibius litoralis TaxID=374515 RepID=A0A967KBC4_9PROT|nr:transcriptional regulator GcvA [Pelagibius litoralis]NIA70289.1 transcriptional regulator GcvA [Pelagibius litoralis]
MKRRLPPLSALRAFEAAARLSSFTKAADELSVTQGAISRQVRSLEDHFDTELFRRGHRSVELTPAGNRLLPALSDAFDRIMLAAERVRERPGEIKIKSKPTIAVRWLIPQILRFQNARPDIQVRLTTAWWPVDFSKEDFDAGIVFAQTRDERPNADLLLVERMTPVCAPALLEGSPPLARPEDLVYHRLLHSMPSHLDWKVWLASNDVAGVDPDGGEDFDFLDGTLQAAIQGYGVAMGDVLLVDDDLRAGRLVTPFDTPPTEVGAYFLVYPETQNADPAFQAFRSWLIDAAEASQKALT